ncbi:hypothetical protein KAR91_67020 [Candidatus Pacearchaeota archaeon]|nr:hypothetical protein [Candidatus Pacearchaeota archaeon]
MPYECDECHEPIINEIPCPLCRCCFDCCMCNIEPATQEEVDRIEKEYEFSVHLQADDDLNPMTAEAIAGMVRCAYDAIKQGKIGKKNRDTK